MTRLDEKPPTLNYEAPKVTPPPPRWIVAAILLLGLACLGVAVLFMSRAELPAGIGMAALGALAIGDGIIVIAKIRAHR